MQDQGDGMLEIESKYPVASFADLEKRLLHWGARLVEDRNDADHYLNAPDRDFAQTDEAFRIRRIGSRNLLTYKGPKIDKETKTRKEIEVDFAEGDAPADDMLNVLRSLGYRPVTIVRKHRRIFELEREGFTLHFCLDEVDKVGTYAEVEIVAEENRFATAKALLLKVAAELGLNGPERRSYLQLLLNTIARTSDVKE
ncbi:MAG: class IV adenylate cyclase [Planctomycetes bacterium]|nr:class IV adenylate cyclase [Planctomycetota bacterium]